MIRNFGIQTTVCKVLGNDFRFQDTITKTFTRRFMVVKLLNQFLESKFKQGFPRYLTVELWKHVAPLDFILETLLPFLSSQECFDETRASAVAKVYRFLHLCAIFLSELSG